MANLRRRRLALGTALAPWAQPWLPRAAEAATLAPTIYNGSLNCPLELLRLGDLGGLPLVALSLQGRATRWLVDTGAGTSVLSRRLVAELGLRVLGRGRVATLAGVQNLRRIALPALEAPEGLLLAPSEAGELDLDAYFQSTGETIDGILGLAGLPAGALLLDFTGQRMVFGDSAGAAGGPGTSTTGLRVSLPLEFEGTLPLLQLSIGARAPEWFVLDSGFPGALLLFSRRASELLAEAPGLPRVTVRELAGPVQASFALLGGLHFGSWRVSDVPTVLEQGAARGRHAAFDRLAGAVGNALFESGTLHLNRDAKRLEIGWPAGGPSLPGGFGFGLRAAAGGLQVGAVLDGSPAARSGLRPGDLLRGVNGKAVAGLMPSAVWGQLRPVSVAEIEVNRAGDHLSLAPIARERFFPALA